MKDRTRMIIALVGGILFLALQALFPKLPFTEEQTLVFVGLIGAYILGEGLEGQRIRDNFRAVLRSHKFWSLVAGLLVILLKSFWPNFPVTEAQITDLVFILGTLILGSGIQGALNSGNKG